MDNQLTVSIGKLPALAEQLFNLPPAARRPLNIVGPPGIGKTYVMDQLQRQLEAKAKAPVGLCTFIASSMDITDFRIPALWNGKMQFFSTEELPFVCHSDAYPERGLLFFDEWTNTEPAIQKMLLQLLQRGMLGKEKLKEGWFIVAAGNRTSDRTFSNTLSMAAANRCINIYATPPTNDEWVDWAFRSGIHESVTAFMRQRPDMLFKIDLNTYQSGELGQPTPRSWEGVSDLVNHGVLQVGSDKLGSNAALVFGLVGNGPGGEYLAFHNLRAEMPDIEAILAGRVQGNHPKKPDVQYSTVMALVYRVEKDTLKAALDYMEGFSPDFQVLFGKDFARKNRALASSSKDFNKWLQNLQLG